MQTYNTNSIVRFNTTMLKQSLYGCSYRYIHVNVNLLVTQGKDKLNNEDKKVVFKGCVPFSHYISEKDNKQKYNAEDTDVVIQIYNLIK